MYSQDPALRERFRRALANSAQYNRITQRNRTTAQTPIITPAEMPPPQATRPNVMINLPPVKKFRGRDGDACSILDFISRIEKNAEYEFPDGDGGKEEAQISMFRTYLGGDAKDYWGMLSKDEKGRWERVKAAYIRRFKTEKEQRLRDKAKSKMVSLKQKPTESLAAYGERAFRLRQMLEASDEPYLVQRFRKGLRDKAIRRLLASHKSGDKEVTIQDLNAQIINICEDDRESSSDSSSDSESSASSEESSDEDDGNTAAKKRSRKKQQAKEKAKRKKGKKALGDSKLRRLSEYEERLKKIEEVANQVDSFHVGNFQQTSGGYQGRQGSFGGFRQYNQGGSGQGYHQQGYQGNQNGAPPIMCFNCGKDGHMARFCREFRGGYQRRQWGPPQNAESTNQAPAQVTPTAPAHNTSNIQGQRITEVPDVAAIEVLSSAVGGVKVVRELVKYTDPAEVFAGERRRCSEMTSERENDTIRVRKRAMVNHPGANEPDPGGPSRSPAPVERPDSEIEMEERPQPTERTQK